MERDISRTFNLESGSNSLLLFVESAFMRTAVDRHVLGILIIVADLFLMGPALRGIHDIGIRIVLMPVVFAVAGLGLALMYLGREDIR